MKMNKIFFILLLGLVTFQTSSLAQRKVITVKGEAQLELERGMTEDELRYLTIFEARRRALEDNFGTDLQTVSMLRIDSKTDAFEQIGVTTVKGRWVRDLQEPKCEKFIENGDTWMKCVVRGKAQEIKKPPIPINVLPLDGPQRKDRTAAFKNDEDFFVYFRAPVDGYLSIYLMLKESVQCLLPYEGMTQGYMKVEADREYILFTEKGAPEYFMWTEDALETNLLVTIFSPEEYNKPFLNKVSEDLPRELSIDDFLRWLGQQSSNFEELQVVNQIITISQ